MILFLILVAGMFLSLVAQEFIPPVAWMYGARVMIMPVVMFYGAMALPYWGTLALAFIGGFMWDALTVPVIDSQVEISLGWSIILYAVLRAIMSGFRPMYHRGRWEVHCLASGVFTSVIVLCEFLMITFRRGGFIFTKEIWWRVGGAGIIAAIIAPLVYLLFSLISWRVGFDRDPDKTEVN